MKVYLTTIVSQFYILPTFKVTYQRYLCGDLEFIIGWFNKEFIISW
jgi:hypothetical protein